LFNPHISFLFDFLRIPRRDEPKGGLKAGFKPNGPTAKRQDALYSDRPGKSSLIHNSKRPFPQSSGLLLLPNEFTN
jgi:hypothetical protein